MCIRDRLGVRPIWDGENRVIGLRPVPLEELKRPRIDVTGHISSVMRDAWPSAIALLDRAVHLVADLDEPETINYVRKNARTTGEARIFGGAPGTYTNSVGLALKASAWKDERDLARYFICLLYTSPRGNILPRDRNDSGNPL